MQTLSFGLGVSMAAAAGAVYGVLYPFNPGSHYDLISRLLSIVVLGGLGSLGGAVLAALAMGVVEAVVAVEISPTWAAFSFFIVLIAFLLVRARRGCSGCGSARCDLGEGFRALAGNRFRRSRGRFPVRRPARPGSSTSASSRSCMQRWRLHGTSSRDTPATSSLGQAAFFGIGAYSLGITFKHVGIGSGYNPFCWCCHWSGSASPWLRSRWPGSPLERGT